MVKHPFETRMSRDMQQLQKSLLDERYFGGKKRNFHLGDRLVFWTSIIIIALIAMGYIHG